jgi:RimJ/RimL family protein N-acetyltransferase
MVEIGRLAPNRWKEYRVLRLEALKNDAIAFGSSYSEEIRLPSNEWKRRIKNALFAVINKKPIGMIVYIFQNKAKIRHIANIFGVYVKKDYRGKGIGGKLVESAIFSIKKNKKVIKINMTVNPRQKGAVKLYKRYGFKTIGVLKKDLKVNGRFYDELIMEKFI